MKVDFPQGSWLYCRSCRRAQPHHVTEKQWVACGRCWRRTLGVELLATYAYDEGWQPTHLYLPLASLPQMEYDERTRERPVWTTSHEADRTYRLTEVDRALLRGEGGD